LRLVIAFFGVTLSLLASTQALASSAIDDAAREFHAAAAAARAFDPTFDDISDQPWANGETRLWNAVEQWTCTWLKEAPGSSVAQFESALAALDKDLGVSGVRLSPKEMLLEINDGEVGNVFIVRTMGAETMIAWRISDAPLDRFPDLNGWRAARGRHPRCSEHDRDHCVPLFGWVGALPDAADGSKRFYIDGQYLAFAGATVGRQISVWRWKSGRAEPLTLRTYSAMIEQSGATRIQGSRLIVPAKTGWKTFFSCGSCEGRQIEQIFELRPTQVRYLGAKVEAPEIAVSA